VARLVAAAEESLKDKVTKNGDKPRSTAPGMNDQGTMKGKSSQEMVGEEGVSCCCGSFW
jgi:hypothetical protein